MGKRIVLALALLGCSAPAAQAATQPLEGPGFHTRFPAGWQVTPKNEKGVRTFTLTTPGTTVDEVGIPSAGGVAVTVGTMTTSTFRKLLHRRAPSSPTALIRLLIGRPRDATNVKITKRPHRTTLGHRRAAGETFSYSYKGGNILQRDVVARRGSRIYWIELDVDRSLADAGQAALRTVLRRWRWR